MGEEFCSNFIWTKEWSGTDRSAPHVVYFRKEFRRAGELRISANCRYKLYLNGRFVQEGPQKGCRELAYRDPAFLGEFLREGVNVAAVEVLYYPEDSARRNDSLYYSPCPCLYVEDLSEGKELEGKRGWKCKMADGLRIVGEPFDPAPIHGMEEAVGESALKGWKYPGYDDGDWQEALPYSIWEANRPIVPFLLEERTIPAMRHEPGRFEGVVCVRELSGTDGTASGQLPLAAEPDRQKIREEWQALPGEAREQWEALPREAREEWQALLGEGVPLTIPAHTRLILELSAGVETCAYPSLKLAGGADARIRIRYAECYGIPQPPLVTPMGSRPAPPLKGDRTDYVNGSLTGPEDTYRVGGFGTPEFPEEYVPFLFRTFRYVRLELATGDEPLTVLSYDYLPTGYPLEVKYQPDIPDADLRRIWDISLRTLRLCMHETYIDCPFYEQLQYTMDSRAEILFTYEVSGDDRLARQCMDAFRRTQRSDGILQASAPAVGVNVIPGFSVFYIMMVHDHMTYFKDKALVREHFGCVDGVLRYFEDHLTEKGLVGSVGGVLFQHCYWSFIDWCPEWDDTIGVPTAAAMGDGSITMESLLYLYGLQKAAELADFIGRTQMGEEYRSRAAVLARAVLDHCMDADGLIQDGPGLALYSTHAQVWAILCGLVKPDQGRRMLENTYRVEGIPQCSVSMSFYLLLALDQIGAMDLMDSLWDMWRVMLKNHMTTCVENFTDQRSDCHAWGAILLYAWPRIYERRANGSCILTGNPI